MLVAAAEEGEDHLPCGVQVYANREEGARSTPYRVESLRPQIIWCDFPVTFWRYDKPSRSGRFYQ